MGWLNKLFKSEEKSGSVAKTRLNPNGGVRNEVWILTAIMWSSTYPRTGRKVDWWPKSRSKRTAVAARSLRHLKDLGLRLVVA